MNALGLILLALAVLGGIVFFVLRDTPDRDLDPKDDYPYGRNDDDEPKRPVERK